MSKQINGVICLHLKLNIYEFEDETYHYKLYPQLKVSLYQFKFAKKMYLPKGFPKSSITYIKNLIKTFTVVITHVRKDKIPS